MGAMLASIFSKIGSGARGAMSGLGHAFGGGGRTEGTPFGMDGMDDGGGGGLHEAGNTGGQAGGGHQALISNLLKGFQAFQQGAQRAPQQQAAPIAQMPQMPAPIQSGLGAPPLQAPTMNMQNQQEAVRAAQARARQPYGY